MCMWFFCFSGIKIGEIGCKLGMNGVNNGYLGFENVRVKRLNMLMKNAQVLKVCANGETLLYIKNFFTMFAQTCL